MAIVSTYACRSARRIAAALFSRSSRRLSPRPHGDVRRRDSLTPARSTRSPGTRRWAADAVITDGSQITSTTPVGPSIETSTVVTSEPPEVDGAPQRTAARLIGIGSPERCRHYRETRRAESVTHADRLQWSRYGGCVGNVRQGSGLAGSPLWDGAEDAGATVGSKVATAGSLDPGRSNVRCLTIG